MRERLVTVTLIWVLAVAATLVAATGVSAHHSRGPCDFHRMTDETIEHLSKRHIRCAVERFGPVAGGRERAACIAERESGLEPKATSATAEYLGLFQHAATYWEDRYETWTRRVWDLPTSALEGRTNAIVTIRMVRDAGGWKAAGWSPRGC